MKKNASIVLSGEIKLPSRIYEGRFLRMAHINFSFIDEGFRRRFLNGLRECSLPDRLICGYDINSPEDDFRIMSIIPQPITNLADFWEMLSRQPNGETGELLTNAMANVFYLPDGKDICAAIAYWLRGWCLEVRATEDKTQWFPGSRVFAYT